MRLVFSTLAFCVLLLTTGPAVSGQSPAILSGTITYWQKIALPANAVIEVKLLDVSRQDAPAVTLAKQVMTAGGNQVPLPFSIQYDPGAIDARSTYTVQARITVNERLMFINTKAYPVITLGGPTGNLQVVLDMVSSGCEFVLGFKALHELIPEISGDCRSNARFVSDRGESVQETTGLDGRGGLFVWRKAGNFTGYTDGYRTWAYGPNGIEQRLNTERFPWEVAQQLSNTEYLLPSGNIRSAETRITLSDGKFDSRAEFINAGLIADQIAIGDLNADGVPDAIAPIYVNTGGSGIFEFLFPFVDHDGLLIQAQPEFLGDRVKINRIAISEGATTLNMITQGPNEPMCCPTMPVTGTFKLLGNKLEPMVATDAAALQNRTWEWQRRVNRGQETLVSEPAAYSLTFSPNGSFNATLDCNKGLGGYAAGGRGTIRMDLGPVTLAECGPASRYQDMIKMLSAVKDYRIDDNGMVLRLLWPGDGPVDYFRATSVPNLTPKPAADALNSSYTIQGRGVTLVDGKAEQEIVPGAATKMVTTLFGRPTMGDLNGDGYDDAALIIVQDPGGSGTFFYAAAALYDPATGKTAGTNAVPLGDRIAPQNIFIEKSVILANYAVRQADEPMTAQPSVGVTKRLVVDGTTLKETAG